MNKERAGTLMKWATRAAMSVALCLVAIKFVAWWRSGSVAMQGSLADSILDLTASIVTFFAVKTALVPADDDHRFGHGKAEALAGLFQSAIMAGSAVFLFLESINRVWEPKASVASELVIGVSVLAIALSLCLVMFQAYVVKQTRSLAIAGDHLHYKGDLAMNLGVVIAAYAGSIGYIYADGIFGALIAFYIIWGARDVAMPAIDMLMDKEMSESERNKIIKMAVGNASVLGLHELKTRMSGRDYFIQMHLEVDGNLTVQEGHDISEAVEGHIAEEYPEAEILIHIDPPVSDL
ncbi:MAG: cation diffusion facilitator family transporter [Kordiimonas sp.]